MKIDHDDVFEIIQQAAADCVLPLWQNLNEEQVSDKGDGELVTAADAACEALLARLLPLILPGSLILGEESCAAEPALLDTLQGSAPVWVIDPLDGTRNFAAHRGPFAIMLCLILRGETLAAWIYDPLDGCLTAAERGGGAFVAGQRVHARDREVPLEAMHGALLSRFLPAELRPQAEQSRELFASSEGSGCAGWDYRQLVSGQLDFLLYYRTLVWDHAPGLLVAAEAGIHSGRYNGAAYSPLNNDSGLICAHQAQSWRLLRDTVVPGYTAL